MLRTIVCMIGAASALQVDEQPNVAEMIDRAIHAQIDAKSHTKAKIKEEPEVPAAVDQVAKELVEQEGGLIKQLIKAEKAGHSNAAQIQATLGGFIEGLSKEIHDDGGYQAFVQTGVKNESKNHHDASSFIKHLGY